MMSSGSLPATPSLKTIESAIELIDVKKGELKKAFDDLQATSLRLSSFSITWSELESHFTALQNSVTQRFHFLESRESSRHPVVAAPVSDHTRCSTHSSFSKQGDPSASKPLTTLGKIDPVTDSVVTRPELKEFCKRMDWRGLRKYINDHDKELEAIQMELPGALKSAPYPGTMVLDAMEGFYVENCPNKGDKDMDLLGLRRVCVSLLEGLMETGLCFSEEVRERAKKLALEWNGKVNLSKANTFEPLAFLLLMVTYSLEAVVDKGELVGHFFVAAGCRKAVMLCRSIGLGEKVYDLIQKLVDNGKQHLAVRFIFEFGLAEKFPPVPLLDNYLKETKKLAEQVCVDGKNSYRSLNVAAEKEIGVLKSVIKVIKDCRLEAEYPQECLQDRLEQLEMQLADRKRTAKLTAAWSKQQQAIESASQQEKKKKKKLQGKQQQTGNKRPKTTTTVSPMVTSFGVAGSSSVVLPFRQSHLQPAGLFPDQPAAYLSSLTGPYGLAGPTPAVNPYLSSSATALFGLAGALLGFSTTPNPAASHPYSYGQQPFNGAYGLPPQYHPQ